MHREVGLATLTVDVRKIRAETSTVRENPEASVLSDRQTCTEFRQIDTG